MTSKEHNNYQKQTHILLNSPLSKIDYNNINEVFDGRSRGRSTLSVNDFLPAGIYFYIFDYETSEGVFTDSEYLYISK